jgi:hypothetical protein
MYALIHPLNIGKAWPNVAPWIAQAMGDAETWKDLDYLKNQALHGELQIWVGENPKSGEIDIVLVTEPHMIGAKPVLVVRWMCAESLEDKLPDFGLLEYWAREQGFHRLQIWGRKGWERKLKPLGYRHEFVVLTKDVDRGIH